MSKEIRVQYSRAGSGSIQFGDDVMIANMDEFNREVAGRIETEIGRDDVFDFTIKDGATDEILFFQKYGVPVEIAEIVARALLAR